MICAPLYLTKRFSTEYKLFDSLMFTTKTTVKKNTPIDNFKF